MRQLFTVTAALVLSPFYWGGSSAVAQSLDDLNLQVHGFATQGFLYSSNNNWNTLDTTSGSSQWTEAVVNLTAQPQPKLRIGLQARYYLLGDYGNEISLDWAQADYKFNEKIGFRVGMVKSPTGLLNEAQDIDPSLPWVLLPQSIYPLTGRDSTLSHYGGVAYGQVALGDRFGKLEYRAFGGQRVLDDDDAAFQPTRNNGLTVPHGVTGRTFGGTLRWNAPIAGLVVGASENSGAPSGAIQYGALTGTIKLYQYRQTYYFTKYERRRVLLAGEFSRYQVSATIQLPGRPAKSGGWDQHLFYGMASYKLTDKLTAGFYYSSAINLRLPVTNARFQKDWTFSGCYDFNPFLYLKAEQHWMDGTLLGYSNSDNTNLRPNSRMTLLKLGVSF